MTDNKDDMEEENLPEFDDELADEDSFIDEDLEASLEEEDFLDENEEDFAGEDWEEEEFDTESLQKSGKKPFLSFNTIVIGLGIILGLGIFTFQLAKSPSSDNTGRNADAPAAQGIGMSGTRDSMVYKGRKTEEKEKPENKQSESSETVKNKTRQGLLDNPDKLDLPEYQPRRKVPTEVSDPPQPKPFSSRGEIPESQDMLQEGWQESEQKTTEAASLANKTVSKQEGSLLPMMTGDEAGKHETGKADKKQTEKKRPSLSAGKEVLSATDKDTTAVEKVMKARSADSGASMEIMDRLDEISDRMSGFETRLDEISKQGLSNGKSGTEISELRNKINLIEDRLENITVEKTGKTKITSSKKTTAQKAVTRKTTGHSITPAPPEWELRAAQPGRAWVSKSGKGEMQMIDVGDKLPGLGVISSISYRNGKWVIEGSSGRITQ